MIKKLICLAFSIIMAVSVLSVPASAYLPFEMEYDLGDVDGNGTVTATDALMTLQNAVGKISLDYAQEDAADTDVSWTITASDALSVLQAAVGKIELALPEHPYENYELNYVDASCLGENKLYIIATNGLHDPDTTRNHNIIRLVACMQGLINRNNDQHKVAVSMLMDGSDQFWIDYMSEEGATYNGFEQVKVAADYTTVIETFLPFIKQCGIIAWDPAVPSTSNVASTICGLDNYLPVMYSTDENSLYYLLTKTYEVPVKMNLCGMFSEAKLGQKIAGTNINSTGSGKCDAYLWAIENYMDRCNPEHIAYTLDGATSVKDNPHYSGKDAYNAQLNGIPNHDYFILKQMFFMDLTSYPGEPASDDPTQPIGTDHDTLVKILMKRYEMANGNFGIVQGFIPWHIKYTSRRTPSGSLDAPRLEWHFVETVGSYNCGIEADAANPCWMSNGSLYTKYEMRNEITGNAAPKEEVVYDPDTYYYCQVYSGDFDCSPWLKARSLDVWDPNKLGKVYSTYDYSTTLIMRVPQIYDYIYEVKTDYEYFTGGEGPAYTMTASIFEGFTGRESNPTTRTLIDGDRAYIHYLRPYYDLQKVSIGGKLINGYTVMGTKEMAMQNEIATSGSFMYNTNAASQLQIYDGIPYIAQNVGASGNADISELALPNLYSGIKKNKNTGFTAFLYNNNGTNYGNAAELALMLEDFEEYISWKDPDQKYQYVDLTTFFRLLAESGKGNIMTSK